MSDVASAWSAALGTALVGTDRKAFAPPAGSDTLGAALERIAGTTDDDAGRLLRTAAAVAAYRRAGVIPPRDDATPVPLPKSESLAPATPDAGALLRRIAAGEYTAVLGEWLALAAERRRRAPADMLPDLLELGRHDAQLRDGVLAVIGERGRWLASHNPDWTYAAGVGDATEELLALWETGSSEMRAAALRRLRSRDPERARTVLEQTWAQESPSDRVTFLETLGEGLTTADEPFLDRALDDRRKEVRRGAAALLAAVPESALTRRMIDRARGLVSLVSGRLFQRARLDVRLPDAPDAALVRDGIEPKPPAGLGERAWWLAQLVGAVPPHSWVAELRAEPAELIRLAGRGEWREAVLAGWLRAAERFRDAAWAEALWANEEPCRVDPRWGAPAPERVLIVAVPPERVHALLRETIAAEKGALRGTHRVLTTLLASPHPWSVALAETVARRLADFIARDRVELTTAFEINGLLRRCAHAVPSAAVPSFTDRWPVDSPAWPSWADQVEAMSSVLRFRRSMHLAFTEEHQS